MNMPKPAKWQKINSKQIFKHPRITLLEDEVRLPDGNTTSYLSFSNAADSVTVLCVQDGKVLIQQEYSYPVDEVMYQLPGGKVEPGEDIMESIHRELCEESGYAAKDLQQLGWYYPDNRRSGRKMYVFLATDVEECEQEGGDAEEFITSEWMGIAELEHKIVNGEIVNYSILTAWALYKAQCS
jgi:ADP-ribose pyrophosphatase